MIFNSCVLSFDFQLLFNPHLNSDRKEDVKVEKDNALSFSKKGYNRKF